MDPLLVHDTMVVSGRRDQQMVTTEGFTGRTGARLMSVRGWEEERGANPTTKGSASLIEAVGPYVGGRSLREALIGWEAAEEPFGIGDPLVAYNWAEPSHSTPSPALFEASPNRMQAPNLTYKRTDNYSKNSGAALVAYSRGQKSQASKIPLLYHPHPKTRSK